MMTEVTAKSGWTWVIRGYALFRQRPAELLALFFAYIFLNMGSLLVPLLGPFLSLVLVPVYSMAFLQASRNIENGIAVSPGLLLTGFRSPTFSKLLLLGVINIVAIVIAGLLASVADGGELWSYIEKAIESGGQVKEEPELLTWVSVFFLSYLPVMVALWYAAPLVAWRSMSIPKAMFFSFFAVLRAWPAFLVFALSWVSLRMIAKLVLIDVIGGITGSSLVVVPIAFSVSILLMLVMYCSFYPAYTDVFGKPEDEDQSAA